MTNLFSIMLRKFIFLINKKNNKFIFNYRFLHIIYSLFRNIFIEINIRYINLKN